MALIPASAASGISSAYNIFAAIDGSGQPTGQPSSGNYAAVFADSYHNYANAGIVPGAVSGGGSKSILQTFMDQVNSAGSSVTEMAQAFTDYWSGVAIQPGLPAHGGVSVVSVTNNAASKYGDFVSAINASYTTSKTDPGFLNLIQNVEGVVKSITWIITEQMSGGGTQAFNEVIT